MEINKKLLDECGMIDGGNDTIGKTVRYAIAYNKPELINKIIDILLVKVDGKYVLYRYCEKKNREINDISRDHLLWLWIGVNFFKIKNQKYDDFLKRLPHPYKKFSDFNQGHLTIDLWLLLKGYHRLWIVSLYFYLVPIILRSIFRFIGDIKIHKTWKTYEYLPWVYDGNKKIKGLFKSYKFKNEIKNKGWKSYWQYWCARSTPGFAYYALRQTSWAIYVLRKNKNIDDSFLNHMFFSYSWSDNHELAILLNIYQPDPIYLRLTPIYTTSVSARIPCVENDTVCNIATKENVYKYIYEKDLLLKLYNINYG